MNSVVSTIVLDLPADRIASIQGGVERFELIPKGVPEIEVFVPNAFQTIKIGEEVNMTATLKNIGTRDLVDHPYDRRCQHRLEIHRCP